MREREYHWRDPKYSSSGDSEETKANTYFLHSSFTLIQNKPLFRLPCRRHFSPAGAVFIPGNCQRSTWGFRLTLGFRRSGSEAFSVSTTEAAAIQKLRSLHRQVFWTSPTQYQMFCSSRSKTSWEVSLSLKNWCGSMLAGTRIAGYLSFTQRCHPVCHCEVAVTLWGREITQIWSLRPDSLKDCKMAANQRLSSARSQSPRKGWCAPRAATPAKRRLSALSVCPHLKEVFCKHLEEKQPIFM